MGKTENPGQVNFENVGAKLVFPSPLSVSLRNTDYEGQLGAAYLEWIL